MAEFDFQQTYFALFELPQRYSVDPGTLTERYRQLQRRFHPDRFAADSDAERRRALQASTFINEAYETLLSPVKRGQYLLSLAGVRGDFDQLTFSDPTFLLRQLELREELAELRALGGRSANASAAETALNDLQRRLMAAMGELQQQFEQQFAIADYQAALLAVAKMQFLQKLTAEAEALAGELLDY